MKKKITLWAVLCMIMVCLMQITVAAAGNIQITQCIISGGNQVTVVATGAAVGCILGFGSAVGCAVSAGVAVGQGVAVCTVHPLL